MGRKFGGIRKLASGRFQARYVSPLDGERRSAPSTFATREEAEAWLEKAEIATHLGLFDFSDDEPVPAPAPEPVRSPSSTVPTVGALVQDWLALCASEVAGGHLRVTSLQTYENIIQNRVLNHKTLCATPVDQLKTSDVANWWRDISMQHPDTPDRNKRAYSKLRGVIAGAVEHGYIDFNPVQLKAARRGYVKKKKALATTAELSSILDLISDRYKFVTVLCLFHGLRVGEALALRYRDISFSDDGEISVSINGTLARVYLDGKVRNRWQPPKTQAGHRVVPVFKEYAPLIRQWLRRYPGSPDDYITRTNAGDSVLDTSYRHAFAVARDKAGVPSEITPHYGRNWLITRLAEAGATPKEIGSILGQEDVSTIVNVYMRVRQQRPAELMKKINLDD